MSDTNTTQDIGGVTLASFPRRLRPYNNITPFTYRDGLTYLEVLEDLREWLSSYLVTHINTELDELIKSVDENTEALAKALTDFRATALADQAAFQDQVAASEALIRQSVASVEASATRAEGAATEAEQWAANTQLLQDAAVTALYNSPTSLVRKLFGGLFAPEPNRWIAAEHGVTVNNEITNSQHVQLNKAATDLSAAGGGELIIRAGETIRMLGWYSGADNVTLVIRPGATVIKENAANTSAVYFDGRRNCHIVGGGTFDMGPFAGNSVTQNRMRIRNSENVSIKNLTITAGARTIQVQSGIMTGTGTNGITQCKNIEISGNRFIGETRDIAVEVVKYIGGTAVAEGRELSSIDVRVNDNYIEKVVKISPTVQPWSGIYFSGLIGGQANRNIVAASIDTGIMLAGSCRNVEVAGNNLTTDQVSIFIGDSTDIMVHDNPYIKSFHDIGISIHCRGDGANKVGRNRVISNTIIETGRNAITVEGQADTIVSNNQINSPVNALVTDKEITSTITGIYDGAIAYTFANTGTETIYVGGPTVTTATGTAVAPGGTYAYTPSVGNPALPNATPTYKPGLPSHGITASGKVGKVSMTVPDTYAAAIMIQPLASAVPHKTMIVNNMISLGRSPVEIIGIRTVGNLEDLVILNNVVDSRIVRRFRFGALFGKASNVQIMGNSGNLYKSDGVSYYRFLLSAAEAPE